MNGEATSPRSQPAAAPDREDDESQIDGCECPIRDTTSDEDLPASEGGVA
jgi:hypothetical protein